MREGNVTIELPAGWEAAARDLEAEVSNHAVPRRLQRIRRLAAAVSGLNAIAASLPKSYGWRFITADAFSEIVAKKAQAGASPSDMNNFYWRDTLATVEAYTVMSVWRMVDICQTSLRCMEEEAVVPCAILARSALESAVQFVQDARTISASLEEVIRQDLSAGLAISTELEQYLLQTVYASRQTGADEIYKSRNILTVIDKIAKVAKDEPIKKEYEVLCEVTHPNFLGRSTYLARAEDDRGDGSELRVISPADGLNSAPLQQTALWALSWAIEAQSTSTHLLQGTVRRFIRTLPPVDANRH